jgi:hypothetical protein
MGGELAEHFARHAARDARAPHAGVVAFFVSALLYACISFVWPLALIISLLLCGFALRMAYHFRRIYHKFELKAHHLIDGRMDNDAEARSEAHRTAQGQGGHQGEPALRRNDAARVISSAQESSLAYRNYVHAHGAPRQ